MVENRDTITPTQPLKDNGEKIISPNGKFELGFFNISTKRYLGIKYHNLAQNTIIWVANRNTPLNNTSGILSINSQNGSLYLTTIPSNTLIWSNNISATTKSKNPIARLLETGNLIIGGWNSTLEDYLWESFDDIGNTFMPTMKLGWNFVMGLNRFMSSWKSDDDPSQGDYIYKIDPFGYPQYFLINQNVISYRAGSWNGERFSGAPNLNPNDIYTFEFVRNQKEVYYVENLIDSKDDMRIVLSPNGIIERWVWNEKSKSWKKYLKFQMDSCDSYNICGPYGICTINNSPICGCLDGFEPKDVKSWERAYWNDGCVRRVKLECKSDGFKRISGVKLPDTRKVFYNKSYSLKECEKLCYENCSCNGFTTLDVTNGGSGCLMWFDDLVDLRYYSDHGQDFYLRVAASELGSSSKTKKLVSILIPVLTLAFGVCLFILWRNREGKWRSSEPTTNQDLLETRTEDRDLDLFDFTEICRATDNFSLRNKLGEGGFGLVYKGILIDGQEIAVKRLSISSKQGVQEFKNEASCIVKLQHRNLVKLLGCCIHENEKLLIYEYMPNTSLDLFIFDKNKRSQIDWPKRFNIIKGIARGLLYLHHDSRLRIIHRDLKTSNILLDQDFNPKISDFGMARIFGGNDIDHQANTNRIVGTYGYMAPEYAVDGHFSTKSDVFSFGVLVLEIVSGQKNREFSHPNHGLNLLGHAWRLYNEEKSLDLVDESVRESRIVGEVIRAIQLGLLCVQKSVEKRPNMSLVVLMLESEVCLPIPNEPCFFIEREIKDPSSSNASATNEISITFLDGR